MVGQVDPAFIQEPDKRAKAEVAELEEIPVIDLSPLKHSNDPEVLDSLIKEIGAACSEWGFFQVINHGVPLEVQKRIDLATRGFFGLSSEEKRKVRRGEVNHLGYYDTEHTKNVADWKEVVDFIFGNPTKLPTFQNRWPESPHDFRDAIEEYAQHMEKLSYKLLELISLSLGLPEKRLHEYFKHHTSFIRLLHYPPCPSPELALGVGAHKDPGALTVLAQDDVGGLEVKQKVTGEWVKVRPTPNSYIINVADCVQVWSNDKYESVEHRARVNSNRDRFSIPFFFNPAYDVMVKPCEELIDDQHPAIYKEYNWGKFLENRTGSNFKKLDVEPLQIHHLKISS